LPARSDDSFLDGLADRKVHRDSPARKELREDLRDMRRAIDKYKDLADQQKIRVSLGAKGIRRIWIRCVKGVSWAALAQRVKTCVSAARSAGSNDGADGMGHAPVQDDSRIRTSGAGKNVFDVYSKSSGTALMGRSIQTGGWQTEVME